MMEEMKQDLQNLGNLSPQRRMILVALIALLFALSILVGSYLLGGQTSVQTPSVEQQTNTPQTTQTEEKTLLSIVPADQTLTIGKPQMITVTLETVPVAAADISLQYDPTAISITNVQNGTVFDKVIRNRVANGTVLFSGAVAPDKKDQLKTGTVFTFTVVPLKAGSTVVVFDKKKTITAVSGVNMLGTASGATLNIQ